MTHGALERVRKAREAVAEAEARYQEARSKFQDARAAADAADALAKSLYRKAAELGRVREPLVNELRAAAASNC
jgi:capsule polysaccharide export protein KpsE/RkpR